MRSTVSSAPADWAQRSPAQRDQLNTVMEVPAHKSLHFHAVIYMDEAWLLSNLKYFSRRFVVSIKEPFAVR